MARKFNRRQLVQAAGVAGLAAAAGAAGAGRAPAAEAAASASSVEVPRVRYCLNTSTIRGQQLSLVEEIELAAEAGYDGIEPWVREIDQYVDEGGSLDELRKRISDLGLTVEGAIGFAEWIVDDPRQRARGLESAKRDMQRVAAIGGRRIAAPPAGAVQQEDLNLYEAGVRYGALVEAGRSVGVEPQLELWGFSRTLSRMGELLLVAMESGQADVLLLPDIYHLHKGGSDFHTLELVAGRAIEVFHMNDYPADPPRESITDAHRVYPGDGVAPLAATVRQLLDNGFAGALSLELFNPYYWEQDPLEVARTGLARLRAVVDDALATA